MLTVVVRKSKKVVRQNDTDVTSLRMQFEKEGRWLLREAFWSNGEWVDSRKRGGKIRKDRSRKMLGYH